MTTMTEDPTREPHSTCPNTWSPRIKFRQVSTGDVRHILPDQVARFFDNRDPADWVRADD